MKNNTNRRTYKTVTRKYAWMSTPELPEERLAKLETTSRKIRTWAIESIETGVNGNMYVLQVCPGIGKSYTTAPLALDYDIGYFCERHNMKESIEALQDVPEMLPPSPSNCPHYAYATTLAEMGYSTARIHEGCEYSKQFRRDGSAFYMHQHIPLPIVQKHKDALIIDEFNIKTFFPEKRIDLLSARLGVKRKSVEEKFLLALNTLIFQVASEIVEINKQAGNRRHISQVRGKFIFDALNDSLEGKLEETVNEIILSIGINTEKESISPYDRISIADLPGDGLATLVRAFANELERWKTGEAFNSLIGLSNKYFYVTERVQFASPASTHPVLMLDATCDERILAKVFPDFSIEVSNIDIEPPPTFKHIWVNNGNRYTKGMLVESKGSDRDRARIVKQIKYLLEKENIHPERIGIVSFMGCVNDFARDLGIAPENCLHYWALRGSNSLEDCDVLLVIGTPMLPLDELYRLSQAVFYDESVITGYQDERFQYLNTFISQSEVTQAINRSRGIRYPNKTVITFSNIRPAYLPPTTIVTKLPQLDENNLTPEDRIEQAIEELEGRGEKVTREAVRKISGVKTSMVSDYLFERKTRMADKEQ